MRGFTVNRRRRFASPTVMGVASLRDITYFILHTSFAQQPPFALPTPQHFLRKNGRQQTKDD
ncbi:MAG: hypothetical protein LBF39_00090 [Prevotellaceae bacterium]|nr:hypothetical protein [Prevotellaceae bacterium]